MIRISELDKYYNKGKADEIHVINNTTLEFGNTGLVCILGESGSGKTTLLNTIGGLDTFQGGSITIDDAAFRSYSPADMEKLRNEKFGYIFQDQFLLQDESAEYNIRLALNMFDISEEEKNSRVDYVLEAVAMKKYKKRLVSQLSGGQQQRIAIARALVKSPDVIFADEPTGSLDEANTMRIMSIIKKISKNCLVILVTHEKRIAEFFADRIIYLSDGKVEKDYLYKTGQTYRYSDDTNLYLKEYNKETFQNKNIKINLYNNEENKEIVLNMVYKDGKLFIQQPSEAEVIFLTPEKEIKIIDDVRPELNIEQIGDFEYHLDSIKSRRKPRLTWKDILRLANGSITLLGRKQILMALCFIITSILLVIATADYITTKSLDKKSIVTEDSHYIVVTGRRSTSAENEEYLNSFSEVYHSLMQSGKTQDAYIGLDTNLSFGNNSYGQIKNLNYTMSDFSYVTIDHFNKKDLILGRMPENRNEIIIDKWLIDIFESSDSVLKSLMPDMNSFLNLEVGSELSKQTLKIVGICDQKEPTIYIDKYQGISMASWADKIASLQQLQAAYPGQYDNIKLSANEVLISDTEKKLMMKNRQAKFRTRSSDEFKVKGTFPDEFGATYIIDDQYYQDILAMFICNARKFMIYTDDKKTMLDYFAQNKGGFDTSYVKLVATDPYSTQMKKFKEESSVTVNSQKLVAVTMFALSLLMLYFTMKSNVIKITNQLSVYRMLGISKRSILVAFGFEIVIITSYTMLPVILLVSGIIKFIASMPSMQSGIVYPWIAVVLLLVFLYLVNIIIGLIPVYNVIKRPPAQIVQRV